MEPLYKEGSLLLAVRLRPKVGSVVIVKSPKKEGLEIVKKLVDIDPEGMLVEGLNPNMSTDSRAFGRVPLENYVGRVLFRLR